MYNLLLISNDVTPYVDLINYFKKDFFNVYTEGLEYLDTNVQDLDSFDFILLNLNATETSNIKMIQLIKRYAVCPLYLFSKNHLAEEKARLMEEGAEGHIDIPFHSQEISSRIKAVLRYLNNVRRNSHKSVKIGKLIINFDNREVIYEGNRIKLTNVEYKLLKILVENHDNLVSKDKIIRYVWDDDSSATDNALGIHITRLRKKLKCQDDVQMIETIWGLGYRLNLKACEYQEDINT
ncbi:MAG: response regulator transcription factor [Tenericutes bacterium]|nr:response regulator transcription factor [Mycoplasmatota bacterium]